MDDGFGPVSAIIPCSGVTIGDSVTRQRGNAMPLEQLANVAEVFGMLIVAITLIFLTVQMRQNTRATKSATANESISMVAAWYRELETVSSRALYSITLWPIRKPEHPRSGSSSYCLFMR
jgi:hypothetical protein